MLNEEYATQIARDWNTKDEASGYEGYVLKFRVKTDFLARYDVHVVGVRNIANTGSLRKTWKN